MTNIGLTSYHHGHSIYFDDKTEKWHYKDTEEPINYTERRACPKCHQHQTEEGHDACIANLPGVMFACCGHGVADGYVAFEGGAVIRGVFDD